jgi:hypothetical protein
MNIDLDLGYSKIGAAVTELIATRRSTAAADPTLAGAISNGPTPVGTVTDAPILRTPSAHGKTAILTRVQHRGGSPIHCAPARRPQQARPPAR